VYWLADGSPEFRQAYDAEVKKYGGTPPFDHKGLVRFRRFPTMPIYRMFFQMLESYRRMTAKTRTLEVLAAHVENDALFFNSGQADVEAIWYNISADPNKAAIGSFEEAFSVAKARAEKGVADMVEGVRRADEARKKAKAEGKSEADQEKAAIAAAKGFTFRDVLERDSDYKDPQQKPGQPQSPMLNKRGLFGPQYRNPLSEMMHESELTNLLSGYRFAEDLFFRAPLGQVIGPVRGADGYYVARCLSRTPGPKVTDLKDEKSREFVEDDYVNHAFQDFVNEVMAKSKIEMKN